MKDRIIPAEVLKACPDGARVIGLTKGAFTLVDAADYGWLTRWSWGITHNGYGFRAAYDSTRKKHRGLYLHRAIMGEPTGLYIDHINGDKLDNRRSNLRLATASQNTSNQKLSSKNRSGFRGVCLNRANGKWRAQIKLDGKMTFLGDFDTVEEAAAAYAAAAPVYHGEFARLK